MTRVYFLVPFSIYVFFFFMKRDQGSEGRVFIHDLRQRAGFGISKL